MYAADVENEENSPKKKWGYWDGAAPSALMTISARNTFCKGEMLVSESILRGLVGSSQLRIGTAQSSKGVDAGVKCSRIFSRLETEKALASAHSRIHLIVDAWTALRSRVSLRNALHPSATSVSAWFRRRSRSLCFIGRGNVRLEGATRCW